MPKDHLLWYDTDKDFSENNLGAFKIFASVAHKIIENIEDETVAFLRKRIPPIIKFLRPIVYDYMNLLYDKVIFEYAANELGIKLAQKDIMILTVQ